VIVEDNCFIGARSEVAEGVIVGEGSVLSMASSSASQRRSSTARPARCATAAFHRYSVVVPGVLPHAPDRPALACAVIVKQWTNAPAPRPRSTNCCGIDPAYRVS